MAKLAFDITGDKTRPTCTTPHGTYRAGFDTHPLAIDIPMKVPIADVNGVSVFWAYLDQLKLYHGFDVNAAFDAMEADHMMRESVRIYREVMGN